MKKLWIPLLLSITSSLNAAYANIPNGSILTNMARPIAIYSVNSATVARVGASDQVLINVTAEGNSPAPDQGVFTYTIIDQQLTCLAAAEMDVWNEGEVDYSKRVYVTLSVPLNRFNKGGLKIGFRNEQTGRPELATVTTLKIGEDPSGNGIWKASLQTNH